MTSLGCWLSAVAASLACASAFAHTPPQWSTTYSRAAVLDSDSVAGVLASTANGARLLSVDGTLRWKIDLCPACANPGEPDLVVSGTLLADGSAWLLGSRVLASSRPYRLLHVLPNGVTDANIDIDEPAQNYLFAARLVADANHAIVLLANASTLRRIRFDSAGTLRETRDYVLPQARDSIFYTDVKLVDDGGFAFVANTRNSAGCDFSPPNCPMADIDVFRVNADGSDRWRASFPLSSASVALDAEGTALVANPAPLPFDQPYLRDIDDAGHVGVARPIAADARFELAAGPVHGHYLGFGEAGLYLIDRSGALVHTNADSRYSFTVVGQNDRGFLVCGWHDEAADVALFDPDTLAVRGEFDIGASTPDGYNHSWSLSADGSVYGGGDANAFDEPPFARIARFAVPGSPAAERIFLDHFE